MKNIYRNFGIIALVAVIGFSLALTACDLDAMSSDHIAYDISGKWRSTGSDWWQIEVTNRKFVLSSSGQTNNKQNSLTVESLTWREVTNDGSVAGAPPSEYPRGFEFTGRITQNNGIFGTGFSTGQTGVTITRTVYINTARNRTVYSGRENDILHKR